MQGHGREETINTEKKSLLIKVRPAASCKWLQISVTEQMSHRCLQLPVPSHKSALVTTAAAGPAALGCGPSAHLSCPNPREYLVAAKEGLGYVCASS